MRIERMLCAGIPAREAVARMRAAWNGTPRWLWVQHSVSHPSAEVGAALAAAFPDTALHVASSCLGAMDNSGPAVGPEGAIGALGLWDADGDYGAAAAALGTDAAGAARDALARALERAGRPGEAPELIWLSASPGREEGILAALHGVVGPDTPVYGGSAADDDVSGRWAVGDGQHSFGAGVVVSVLFPSTPTGHAFQSGFAPLGPEGTVTAARGRRLEAIDGRPARAVYDDWTGGTVIAGPAGAAVPVLAPGTWRPLGRAHCGVGRVPFHLLLHVAEAGADGALTLFADVAVGQRLKLMGGTPDSLTARAARTAAQAMEAGEIAPEDVAGALVVFCGGAMLAMQPAMPEVAARLDTSLRGAPYLAGFSFGEQGWGPGCGNGHGNLMISTVVFGKG